MVGDLFRWSFIFGATSPIERKKEREREREREREKERKRERADEKKKEKEEKYKEIDNANVTNENRNLISTVNNYQERMLD